MGVPLPGVKVIRLGTGYKTRTYAVQNPLPAIYVIEAFASVNGLTGECEVIMFFDFARCYFSNKLQVQRD